MQSSKGFLLNYDMDLLKITHNIFRGNYMNLAYVVDMYEHDNEIMFIKNRQKLDEICMEILRLFHNYSASSFTLIEHTRRFKQNLNNENLNEFYDTEVKKLTGIEVVFFMKELRNYVQHRSLPISTARMNFEITVGTDQSRIDQTFSLNLEELLAWDKWTLKSREYLKHFNGGIEIKLFCKEYYETIVNFDGVFFEQVSKEYEDDINEYKEFKEYIRKLYPSPNNI